MTKRIFVAGHRGMVGSAIVKQLFEQSNLELITAPRNELDLTNQQAVTAFMQANNPDFVIIAAAKVGGIHANNTYPAEFIYQNLMLECNLIHAAYKQNVQGLLFLGSSCIYPKMAPQPMAENALLSGYLEPTNEPYAIAKIAGIKLCESYNRQYGCDYRSVMPTNLYGPNDNFHLFNSHVIPSLLRRFYEARLNNVSEVVVWGSGAAMREFLHVDDMAAAAIHIMNLSRSEYKAVTDCRVSHLNVGTGVDVSIRELAETIARIVGYKGQITFDSTKSDGPPRKLLDTSKIYKLGWKPKYDLESGLRNTLDWYLQNQESIRQM